MKKICVFICLSALLSPAVQVRGQEYDLSSPDNNIRLKIAVNEKISWSVYHAGDLLLKDCIISMNIDDDKIPGDAQNVKKTIRTAIDDQIDVAIPSKFSQIHDKCNQLELVFPDNFSVVFRVYDNGVAYRFRMGYKNEITVNSEELNIGFNGDYMAFFPEEESMISHYERSYRKLAITEIGIDQFCSLPVYFRRKDRTCILFTEADLTDYPGMFIAGTAENRLEARFPKYVLEAVPAPEGPDRNEVIKQQAPYIARTTGIRDFPWRVFTITANDAELVQSTLVYQLSSPPKITETSWIKPGKVAWDWWNNNNIYGVDFPSGINTATYKYYIDFAAQYGLDYIILDEGWSKSPTDILTPNPDLKIAELISYGKGKNIGIILWTLWKPLEKDMEKVLDTYKEWGVKGVKVDYMQRSDQYMVNYYERVARETAARNLIVDFHGAFKPSGLNRMYPNVLSFEGVKGLEHDKWSEDITPGHDVTLPFVRMVAGPMDYTPGAMDNAQKNNFCIRFSRPMSQGTRSHQVAMYVVYESPLQMMADNPSNYYREWECTEFISKIPVTWDETRVLNGEIGEYIMVARRKENTWYIGAMTNQDPRELEADLSFLPEGNYTIEIIRDGVNAERNATDYTRFEKTLDSRMLEIKMAAGGGWAAIIKESDPGR